MSLDFCSDVHTVGLNGEKAIGSKEEAVSYLEYDQITVHLDEESPTRCID